MTNFPGAVLHNIMNALESSSLQPLQEKKPEAKGMNEFSMSAESISNNFIFKIAIMTQKGNPPMKDIFSLGRNKKSSFT